MKSLQQMFRNLACAVVTHSAELVLHFFERVLLAPPLHVENAFPGRALVLGDLLLAFPLLRDPAGRIFCAHVCEWWGWLAGRLALLASRRGDLSLLALL